MRLSWRPLVVAALALLVLAAACTSGDSRPPPAPAPTAEAEAATVPAAPREPPATPATDTTLTIAAVGDLMFARDVTDLMQKHGAGYAFERVLPLFEGADLLIGNLEGAFTERGEPLDKKYTFRTPPALAETLALAGFDAVSLANNHSYDFGQTGLEDTLAALEAAGVASFGAGLSAAQAFAPALLEVDGVTVALLGFDDIGETRFAEGDGPGVARASQTVWRDIERAATSADYVIVMIHAGNEYERRPTGWQRELARSAIEAGADVVIGHHPHVLQPWERYKGGLILYSLGNFVFDLDPDDLATLGSGPFETAVAMITLSPDAPPAVEFRPAYIDPVENRPRPASLTEAAPINEALEELVFVEPYSEPARVEGEFALHDVELLVASYAFVNTFPSERRLDRLDRVYRDGSGDIRVDVLLTAEELGVDGFRSVVADGAGREIIVAICARGDCGGFGPPSEDALTVLHRSTDGGRTWERYAELPGGVWLAGIGDGGVVLREPALPGDVPNDPARAVRWYPSGDPLEPPAGARPTAVPRFERETGDRRWWSADGRSLLDDDGELVIEFPVEGDVSRGGLARVPGSARVVWSWREWGRSSPTFVALFDRDGARVSPVWQVDYGCCRLALHENAVIVPSAGRLPPELVEKYADELPRMQDGRPYPRTGPAVLDPASGVIQSITDPFAREPYQDRDGLRIIAIRQDIER